MKYCYFPGCTLKNKAVELEMTARLSALALGAELCEISEWQCCGGVYINSGDNIVTKLSSVRALEYARTVGQPLVTLCSACHNVIKQTNYAVANDSDFRNKVNNYLELDVPYCGEAKVIHYLEMLRDDIGFNTIKRLVKNPLSGKRIAPYYGCLLLRPSAVMKMDDPENPTIFEMFIKSIGAEPINYPYRNECCGGYAVIEDVEFVNKCSSKIMESAIKENADCIITACPLCKYNLSKCSNKIPVYYFTELLAEALGVGECADE